MNITLVKALLVLAVTSVQLSARSFINRRNIWSGTQLIGAACLVMVAVTHIFEALKLFPYMRWGEQHSLGHYLDLSSAVLGLTLIPIGYLFSLIRRACIETSEALDGMGGHAADAPTP